MTLFKVLASVKLFEKMEVLNSSEEKEFAAGYVQVFGVVTGSIQRASEIVTRDISNGAIIEMEIIPWGTDEFHSEFPAMTFDADGEGVIYRSGHAFYQE